ncbi:MAG: hypothetical protein FWH18_05600 [Marinilabiliaceae bacterium]|nr:hypothetical protein [Marinilabiliaceae bacterium]
MKNNTLNTDFARPRNDFNRWLISIINEIANSLIINIMGGWGGKTLKNQPFTKLYETLIFNPN